MPVIRLVVMLGVIVALWYLIAKVFVEFGFWVGISAFCLVFFTCSKVSNVILSKIKASKAK